MKPLDLVKTVRSVSVTTEIAHDLSRPVRSMKHASATRKDDNPVSEAIDGAGKGKPMVHDTDFVSEVVPQHFRRLAQPVGPGVVSVDTSLPSAALPVPTKTCNGTGGNGDGVPPDPQLAVGTTQVLEAVNSRFTIFPKSGCANDQPGTTFATFFSGFPGPGCNASASYSDPVVLWDVAAQRWLMEIIDTTNSDLCMAVSATSDATGAWHRYGFLDPVGGDLPDYTKMGVWGDAYYSSTDEFIGETGYEGPSFCAYDRSAMVTGATATRQCFTPANNSGLTSSYIAAMPSTIDGPNLPPAGEPEWFVSLTLPNVQGVSNALAYWKMHVDWTTPANSTLSGPTNLSVTGYTPACSMNQSPTSTCVPTAPPGVPLDGLGQYAMFRLAYRNFGDHESMVISHSVDTGIARNQTETQVGERWYELRPSGSALSVFQQGTFSPDTTTYRWMGSIAQDHSGNMALGYSVSSSSIVPGVRYTGRLATDPLGTMNAGEVSVYQPTSGGQFLDRWGDYTEMSVDPTDDCTFWYVGEAIDDGFVGTGPYTTPIAAFKFPSCTAGGSDFSIGASPSSLTVQQGAAGTVNVSTTITAGSADAVTLSASGMPSGVTASFSPASINSGQSSTLTLTASSTATLGTAPVTITGTGTAHTHTASVSLTVSSTGDDFSMSASPTSVTVAPGGSAPVAISTAVTNGAAQSIALSASGLPSGVSAAFAPATISAGQSSTLTLTATSGAPATLTGITVTGTGASATHSVMVNVTVTSPPPSIPFTPNTSMFPNSLNQAFLVQKDSEPTMATAEDGSIYINAPIGGGGGCHVWSVDRPGPTPHYLGQSDGGYGGADCDVATSRTKDTALNPAKDLVAAASLAVQAAQIHTSASFDAGNTWVQNPNGTQTPADDRMWLSAGQKDKPDEFFMTYRQAPGTGFLIVMKSEDGGLTYTTTGPPINNVGTPTSNFTSWEGNIVVDPNDSNNVYVVFMGSPANNHATATEAQVIWLGSSHDGGVSWQESVVHDGGAGKAYGSIFPSLTMDTSGRLWATYTDGVDMFVARSPGVSPAPEGAWTQITLPRPTLDGRPVVHTAFPWITSSVPGQVDVAWLGSNDAVSNANSNWGLFFARLINGSVSTVEKANTSDFHHGWVCVSGSGCGNVGTDGVSTSGDRRMGDFITIRDDSEGLAHIAFTHDPDCPCGGTNQPDGRGSYIQYVREKPTQLDHIKVSPASATITTDGAQAYTVEGLNKYGDSLGDVTSSASFSISGGGTCTGASCTAGTPGTYTVTANVGGKLATASLQVNPGALAHVVLSPATASIVAGGSQAYTATGSDAHNNSLGDVTGSTVFTVTNGTCTTNSCSSTLAGAQTVTGNDNGVIGTAALTVTPGSLASMSLSPANNSAIVGTDVTYTATGFDAYGNTIGNVTPATTFTILPDGGCAANKCHANSTGNHTVTGKNGAVVATATLIGVVGTVDHIVVSPASATIAAGGQQAYVADAYDAGGNFLGDMTGSAAFTISPNGTCSGNQCGSTKAGAHTVTGNVAGALGTASLTVVAGPASQIALSPKDSRTVVGGSQVYTVASSDQYGNSTGDVTSSAILTISPEGSCTGAQCTAAATGPHTVGAAVGTMTAQATLHVVPAAPTITSPAAGSRGGSPVTVAGTAPAGSTVRVVDEGHNVVASNLPVTGGTWSTQVEFASGVHTITAFALQSGELSDASAARTFTVDATGPTVSINRPGGYLLFGLYPGVTNVHGMARDNTAVTSITTTYTNLLTGDVVHSSYLHCATCPAASVQWDDQPSLGPGLWEVSAVAVDEVGNVSTPDVMDFITLG